MGICGKEVQSEMTPRSQRTTSAVAHPIPRFGSEICNRSRRKTKIGGDHLFLCNGFNILVKCTE